MNDALVMTAEPVSVPPDKNRPWWKVRRPLLAVLGALLLGWGAMSLNRSSVQNWMVKELPLNDEVIIRLAGYSAPE